MTKNIRREILLEIKDKLVKNPTEEFISGLYKILGKEKPAEEMFEQYPELDTLYSNTGNTPIEEPELSWDNWDKTEVTDNGFIFKYAEMLKKAKDIDLSKYPSKIGKQFVSKIALKVNGKKDDAGAYKYSPNFKDIDLVKVNIYEAGELFEIMKEKEEKTHQMSIGFDEEIDSIEEYMDELAALTKSYENDMFKKALKIVGLKASDLTEWEKHLLTLNILAEAGMIKGTSYTKESL